MLTTTGMEIGCLVQILSLVIALSSIKPSTAISCDELLPGQYYCVTPEVDPFSQTHRGCSQDGSVPTQCFTAPNITCTCSSCQLEVVDDSNVTVTRFMRPFNCRFVQGRRYDYYIAVGLSLFLGMLGIDRFYLGYPAIGLLKLCTVGFFLIGHLVDFLLILVQAVGPADRSEYFTPFYGPLADKLNPASTYMEITNSTQQCLMTG